MKPLQRGLLVVVEGIDGSGKSTLVRNLAQALHRLDLPIVVTKEPGGTELGIQLRHILQTQPVPLTPAAEFLLFAADRAQHFTQVIIPHLQNKQLIISDRMGDSSLVYQGFGRGLDLNTLQKINRWVMQGITPDLIIFADISAEQAVERLKQRNLPLTAFEKQLSFIKKLEAGFRTLYHNQEHVILVDATQSPEQITEQASTAITQWLQKNNLFNQTSLQHSGSALTKNC